MRFGHECLNARCSEYPLDVDPEDMKCPACGNTDLTTYQRPENADDINLLRQDYNQRMAAEDPNFTPCVSYDRNGKPIVN